MTNEEHQEKKIDVDAMLGNWSKLPKDLQNEFFHRINGALMVLDAQKRQKPNQSENELSCTS